MLSARYSARRREMAVRAALGAGRGRLLRQLLTEILMLFAAGAAAGFVVAIGATAALEQLPLPANLPIALELSPDLRVLAFAVGISLAAGARIRAGAGARRRAQGHHHTPARRFERRRPAALMAGPRDDRRADGAHTGPARGGRPVRARARAGPAGRSPASTRPASSPPRSIRNRGATTRRAPARSSRRCATASKDSAPSPPCRTQDACR